MPQSNNLTTNKEIADMFNSIAELIQFVGPRDKSDPFRVRAYLNAAQSVINYADNIQEEYNQGKLKEIKGLGKDTFKKVKEYLETGTIKEYEKLKKGIPDGLLELMEVQGVGPKITKQFYEELGIESIQDLRNKLDKNPETIISLERMGKQKVEQIKKGLDMYEFTQERRPIGYIYDFAIELKQYIADFDEVKKVEIAGSLRRMKENIGDLDFLIVTANSEKTIESLVEMSIVDKTIAKGNDKVSIFTNTHNIQIDFRFVNKEAWGAALSYFTGSKEHNIELRKIAKSKGYKLSEYGIFEVNNNKKIGGKKEKDIYDILDMQYVEPEMRENQSVIEKAKSYDLPNLVKINNLKGDLHVHSDWSEGSMSLEELILASLECSYEYVGISDHSQSLTIANGLNSDKFEKRTKEINKLRDSYSDKIKILIGTECDILSDGSLDYEEDLLRKCDFVIAAIHMKQSGDQTERYLKALDNPYINILGHPTGRQFTNREEMKLDLKKIFDKAIKNNIAMEVNSQPSRLDLKDKYIRQYIKMGGKIVINSDAHSRSDLFKNNIFGIGQARRGWAEAKDIINTWSYNKLYKFFNKI